MRGVAPKDGALGYGWTYTEEVREEARLRMGHFIDRACVDRREGGHTELYLRRVCGAGGFEAYKEARYGALLVAKLVARDCLHLPELADDVAGFVLPRTRIRKSMSGAARRRCESVDEANAPPCDA